MGVGGAWSFGDDLGWGRAVCSNGTFLFCGNVSVYFNVFRDPVNDCLRNVDKDGELFFFSDRNKHITML